MAVKTIEQLKEQTKAIKEAVNVGEVKTTHVGGILDDVIDTFDDSLEKNILSLETEICRNNLIPFPIYEHASQRYIGTDGTSIGTSLTKLYIEKVTVTPGDKIRINGVVQGVVPMAVYGFYSKNIFTDSLVRLGTVLAKDQILMIDEELTVPANANYIFYTGNSELTLAVGDTIKEYVDEQLMGKAESGGYNGSLKDVDAKYETALNELSYIKADKSVIDNVIEQLSSLSALSGIQQAVEGYYEYNTGSFVVSSGRYSQFFEIEEGKNYYASGVVSGNLTALVVFYDASGNYLGYQHRGTNNLTEDIQREPIILLKGTSVIGLTSRNSHGVLEVATKIDVVKTGGSKKTLQDIDNEKISAGELSFYIIEDDLLDKGKNLYNKALQINGENGAFDGYLDDSGNVISHSVAKTTYFIPIEETTYYAQGMYGMTTRVGIYDKSYNLLSLLWKGKGNTAPADSVIEPIKGQAFVRFSIRDINTFMLEKGDSKSSYQAYHNPMIKTDFLPTVSTDDLFLSTKRIVVFGDSITQGGNSVETWSSKLCKLIGGVYFYGRNASSIPEGSTVINMGSSGMRITYKTGTEEITDLSQIGELGGLNTHNVLFNWIRRFEEINKVGITPDIIVIAAGTNDISQNSAKGSFDHAFSVDYDSLVHTQMGDEYRRCIEYLQTHYPDAQIFYCTPIHGLNGGRNYNTLKEVSDINAEISKRMQVIVVDTFNESGINMLFEKENSSGRDLYDGVHPHESGTSKIAHTVYNVFKYQYKNII